MLAFELKETERVDLLPHLRQFCTKGYGSEQTAKVDGSLAWLHAMRQSLDTIRGYVGLEQAKDTYGRWLNCCQLIESRFPNTKQSMMFTWKDAFRPKTTSKRDCGMPYEKIAVIFNIGAIHSKLGAQQDRGSVDGTKKALKHFCFAAGAFNFVRENVPSGTTTGDLSEYSLKMCTAIMLAQAQSCFYEKAVKEGHNRSLLAKLANQTADYYNSASGYARKMGHGLDKVWGETLVAQENGFRAAAHYQMAMHEKEQCLKNLEGFGKCIARMKYAIAFCEQAGRMLSNHMGPLKASLQAEKAALERDNSSVYHEPIPDSFTGLALIEKISMVKPEIVEMKDFLAEHPAYTTHRDALEALMPAEVRSAEADFHGRVEAMLVQVDDEFKSRRAEADKMLAENRLPMAVGDEATLEQKQKLPDNVWEKVQAAQSQGGIEAVQSKINAFGEMEQLAKSLVDRVSDELDKEKQTDQESREQYGAGWSRLPSDALNSQFKTQIASYTAKLNQAVEANQQILARLEANAIPVGDRMKMTRNDLEAQIPQFKVEDESSVSSQKKLIVREKLTELEKAFEVAEAKKAELRENSNSTSIGVDLLAAHHAHTLLSTVIQDHITALQPMRSEVTAVLEATVPAEKAIQDSYDDFKGSVPTQVVENSKATYLADLDRAATAISSCLADANDGAQFFQRLLEYLRIVQQQVNDFVLARSEEAASEQAKLATQAPPVVQQPSSVVGSVVSGGGSHVGTSAYPSRNPSQLGVGSVVSANPIPATAPPMAGFPSQIHSPEQMHQQQQHQQAYDQQAQQQQQMQQQVMSPAQSHLSMHSQQVPPQQMMQQQQVPQQQMMQQQQQAQPQMMQQQQPQAHAVPPQHFQQQQQMQQPQQNMQQQQQQQQMPPQHMQGMQGMDASAPPPANNTAFMGAPPGAYASAPPVASAPPYNPDANGMPPAPQQ